MTPEELTRLTIDAEAGDLAAVWRIAAHHMEADRMSEAELWWRRAAELGESFAMYNLGVYCLATGRGSEAVRWLHRSAENGNPAAAYDLANLYREKGATTLAEKWYRAALDNDYDDPGCAIRNLGLLCEEENRLDDAERLYRMGAERGIHMSMLDLGTVLSESGRTEEAERWLRTGAEAGDPGCMNTLGALLVRNERASEGVVWWRRAADAGEPTAIVNYGALLEATDKDEAERLYRRGLATGHPTVVSALATLLRTTGRTEEAERLSRQAKEGALENLPFEGRIDPDVAEKVETLVRRSDEGELAETLVDRQSAEMNNLGKLLARTGEYAEAEKWFERAAAEGDDSGFGEVLQAGGRLMGYRSVPIGGDGSSMPN